MNVKRIPFTLLKTHAIVPAILPLPLSPISARSPRHFARLTKMWGKKIGAPSARKSNNLIGCLNGLAGPMGAVAKDE